MTRRSSPSGPAGRLQWNCLAIACLGLAALSAGCGRSQSPQTPAEGSAAAGDGTSQTPAAGREPTTAAGVLQNMVAAYKKASSYADAGTIRVIVEHDQETINETFNFSLTLVRPNMIRMQVFNVMLVCDGRELLAAIENLPGQVLAKPAPAVLTMESIYADRILKDVLRTGPTWDAEDPPQLALLLGDDPLASLCREVTATSLDDPASIGGRACHRVALKGPSGTTVFWIDRESYVLRRIEFPTDEIRASLARKGTVGRVVLAAEFEGAGFDGQVDAKAFGFEIPSGAERAEFLVPPDPGQLLAKRVPDFEFPDLDGRPVTPRSLAGKIVVLDFWSVTCEPCRISLPALDRVRQRYEANDKIALFAVSVDPPAVDNETVREAIEQLGVRVPVLRDVEFDMGRLFRSEATPTRFIIDGEGMVQYFEVGLDLEDFEEDLDAVELDAARELVVAHLADALSQRLDKLLAGEDICQEPLAEYQERLKEYRRWSEGSADAASSEQPAVKEIEVPRAEIAPRSEPQTVKLTRLWECTELKAPGNILVIRSADGSPRLLVADAGRSVAEVGPDGKLITDHPLDLSLDPETGRQELATSLRTAVGADGTRYVAMVASGQQRFHLLDGSLKHLLSYPQDALENRHSGIADVQLGDLDGDGTLDACVGYWGLVGVQAVSLEGKRIWSNRSLSYIERIALIGPDEQGRRSLLCTSARDVLTLIGPDGQREGETVAIGRPIHCVLAADLTGDGQPELCALTASGLGENVAVGLSLQGEGLWSYALPRGVFELPIEPIVAGKLLPGGSGQWLLPAADGSIHVLSPDGRLLDRFNYGAALAGLATAELDGRPLLIVSTPGVLEAWTVE